MSFFAKFVLGGAVAGGLTLYYHEDIERTTDKLSADLSRLSDQLVHAAPSSSSSAEAQLASNRPVIPQRLPFSEELKARWNEQLGSAFYTLQTTDYPSLISRSVSQLRSSLASASSPAPPSSTSPSAPATLPFPEPAVSATGATMPVEGVVEKKTVKEERRLV
ncbi:hypothetical protein JCM8547_004412 [Rhodosporidiobolus lusitaniae]